MAFIDYKEKSDLELIKYAKANQSKATQGRWLVNKIRVNGERIYCGIVVENEFARLYGDAFPFEADDAEFIVEAYYLIPALIERIEALSRNKATQELKDATTEEIQQFASQCVSEQFELQHISLAAFFNACSDALDPDVIDERLCFQYRQVAMLRNMLIVAIRRLRRADPASSISILPVKPEPTTQPNEAPKRSVQHVQLKESMEKLNYSEEKVKRYKKAMQMGWSLKDKGVFISWHPFIASIFDPRCEVRFTHFDPPITLAYEDLKTLYEGIEGVTVRD